jgi:hypothetical protein
MNQVTRFNIGLFAAEITLVIESLPAQDCTKALALLAKVRNGLFHQLQLTDRIKHLAREQEALNSIYVVNEGPDEALLLALKLQNTSKIMDAIKERNEGETEVDKVFNEFKTFLPSHF